MEFKSQIEICEMPDDDVSGRVKIKMSALKISENDEDNNGNGINWVEQYVTNNLKSIIGSPYKVTFVDDDKTIPSGHGDMQYDDDGNIIFPDSDAVGTIQDAYISEIDFEGKNIKVLMTEGYLFIQSYPSFVKWLKEQISEGSVFGSVEINGKSKAKKIIYENGGVDDEGNPKIGRKPQKFDFTAIAILSDFVEPADHGSMVIEINNKAKSGFTYELNELSYDEIASLISRAFNKAMDNSLVYFYLYKLYPESSRAIFYSDNDVNTYYLTKYSVQNNSVSIGELIEVEQDWKPVEKETGIEFNSKINIKLKEETDTMEANAIIELNQKIEEKNAQITDLTTKNTDLGAKNSELSEAVTNANKTMEELNAQIKNLQEELNSCKEEISEFKSAAEKAELEAKKAEVNSYFDNEIPKNGFSEEEVSSLKQFVDSVDLHGLKSAESEICAKKFKELCVGKSTTTEVETNSLNTFISIPDAKKKDVGNNNKISFFK